MVLLTKNKSALDVHVPGTIGTFRVSSEDGKSAGVEVRYLLTHVTLSEKSTQAQLLSMLAPVREVFDLKQLGFEEIMQRDIDDARVSLELIPYLLDTSTSGQIKLFPPIVAVALPLKPKSKAPDYAYRKVSRSREEHPDHPGVFEERITAGAVGEEQFEFLQLYQGDAPLNDGSQLSLARDNCTLAIVDGQHRAMALLALYRNLTDGWSDSKRSPYEHYYKVWPDKEIRSYNLDELQLPVMICTFPQLDADGTNDIDVVRAARRVFLTLNKTAKRVSDSRNKLLNDQDIVAECLRETLSYIKDLSTKDDTGFRIWNVELDQEGDRVKIASDAAFSGVSHLYHMIDQILMSAAPARGIESKGKLGAPRKSLSFAYERLNLKDDLTQEQREVNTKVNYSDEIAKHFRSKWREYYVPVIDQVFGKLHPFAAYARATINMNQELADRRDTVLEKMLFDGQATSRTFDEFQEGLNRRVSDNEPNWTTPEIKETLSRVNSLVASRKTTVEAMKANRTMFLLDSLSNPAKKKIITDGTVDKIVRDTIDKIYDNVFSTVAFQTAVVCTFAEAIQQAYGIANLKPEFLNEYIEQVNLLLRPTNVEGLIALIQTFEGQLEFDPNVRLVPGAPTFRQVVLPGELQPAEWPKYRYLLLELWKPSDDQLKKLIEHDRFQCRASVARSLYKRQLTRYCEDARIAENEVSKEVQKELQARCKTMLMTFIATATGAKKVVLDDGIFVQAAVSDDTELAPVD